MKQLFVAATFLLIQNALEAIHYIHAIFDFTILPPYLLYKDETLINLGILYNDYEASSLACLVHFVYISWLF